MDSKIENKDLDDMKIKTRFNINKKRKEAL